MSSRTHSPSSWGGPSPGGLHKGSGGQEEPDINVLSAQHGVPVSLSKGRKRGQGQGPKPQGRSVCSPWAPPS